MPLAIPVSFDTPTYVRIPKIGETAPQAPLAKASLQEIQKAASDNPKLQFGEATSVEQGIAMSLTNAAQLAEKQGGSDHLNAMLKKLGLPVPSTEELQSSGGLQKAQDRIQASLRSKSSSSISDISEKISSTLDQLIHEAAVPRGSIINTSA